jgi:hypothetical protein
MECDDVVTAAASHSSPPPIRGATVTDTFHSTPEEVTVSTLRLDHQVLRPVLKTKPFS